MRVSTVSLDFVSFTSTHGASVRAMPANAADELVQDGGACRTPTATLVDRPTPGLREALKQAERTGFAALRQVARYYGCEEAVAPARHGTLLLAAARLGSARTKLERRIATVESRARGVETQAHIVCRESLSPLSRERALFVELTHIKNRRYGLPPLLSVTVQTTLQAPSIVPIVASERSGVTAPAVDLLAGLGRTFDERGAVPYIQTGFARLAPARGREPLSACPDTPRAAPSQQWGRVDT
jgi:hypothetical protein